MIFYNNNENCIEFLNNQHSITVSFCMQKWINKVKKLKEQHPDDVKIIAENDDGSICAKLPIKYLKLSAPKQYLLDKYYGMEQKEEFSKFSLRTFFFDIEVEIQNEFPDPVFANYP